MQERPNALAMEKNLLSALMLQGGAAVPEVAELVSAEDFYRPEHKIIFSAILAAADTDTPLDVLLVEDELQRRGELEKVSRQYLFSLIDMEFSTARATHYAKIIREKAHLRRLIEAGQILIDKASRDDADATELAAEFATRLTNADTAQGIESAKDLAIAAFERAAAIDKSGELTGVTTGLLDLNKVTNGLQSAELIILAARPSMGKTALALNIAQNAAAKGNTVLVFSLEMGKGQLGARLLSAVSGVDGRKLTAGGLTDSDYEKLLGALDRLSELPLYVDDTSGQNVARLRMTARRFKQKHELALIVVDYLQLMHEAGKENRVQEISAISRGLKLLAKELNVPILALSQLSRNVEMRADKRPQLSDLRESGSLEQDADVVMFLYRDEYYNRDDADNQNLAELIIAKNRNGATASIRLHFDKELTRFGDLVRDYGGD